MSAQVRSAAGTEVDLILEDWQGQEAEIEVKASAFVKSDDFDGLRAFQTMVGKRFRMGVVLYLGDQALPSGDRLQAAPLVALRKP